MIHPPSATLLELLKIDSAVISRSTSVSDVGRAIFESFIDMIHYDATENFLSKTLFFSPSAYEGLLGSGLGLSCQEQYFLLRDILAHFGINSTIVHGDVKDSRSPITKRLFATAVMIPDGGGFWHLDSISKLCRFIPQATPVIGSHFGEEYEIVDDTASYSVYWNDASGFQTNVSYYKDIDENIRVERLRQNYADPNVVPYGVITPFYWVTGPTRKIFYDVFEDKVRLQSGSTSVDLDLLSWDMHPASDWLSERQKARVFRCISDIEFNIDQYQGAMAKFLVPIAQTALAID